MRTNYYDGDFCIKDTPFIFSGTGEEFAEFSKYLRYDITNGCACPDCGAYLDASFYDEIMDSGVIGSTETKIDKVHCPKCGHEEG